MGVRACVSAHTCAYVCGCVCVCVFVCTEAFEVELLLWLLSEYIYLVKVAERKHPHGQFTFCVCVCVRIVPLLLVSGFLCVYMHKHLYNKQLERRTLKWNRNKKESAAPALAVFTCA